ncbi:MAG: hypothetical protein E6K80_11565, partial [Candidatus Eisenbacteria bacterium]
HHRAEFLHPWTFGRGADVGVDVNETIAAICTAPGAAGLAVVRVSGSAALAIADRVFRGAGSLASAATHTLHHGWAWEPGSGLDESGSAAAANGNAARRRLDEVVAGVFRAPRSYTGEDVVELSCYGGRFSAERVLGALLATGARLARPGEFTLRAFLNGKVDLARAEAVADVIQAETAGARSPGRCARRGRGAGGLRRGRRRHRGAAPRGGFGVGGPRRAARDARQRGMGARATGRSAAAPGRTPECRQVVGVQRADRRGARDRHHTSRHHPRPRERGDRDRRGGRDPVRHGRTP